jgi:methionyl-tRNA formyltransferase
MLKGVKLDIYDASKVDGKGRRGEVIAITDAGIAIAGADGAILAKRVKAPDGKKIAAAEWAKSADLAVGDMCDAPKPKPAP